jgi:pimeloyl-ACP methyl ester carboxylesterase
MCPFLEMLAREIFFKLQDTCMNDLDYSSIMVPAPDGGRLHVRRIRKDREGEPVLMLHGSIENGKVFYSEKGAGLAPWLARKGYDVFVAHRRGRGGGEPPMSAASSFSQTEEITEDIPALMESIREIKGDIPLHWVAHSWGGVIMTSHLVRFPENIPQVKSLSYFGTKRFVSVINPTRILQIDAIWSWYCRRVIRKHGYLPAESLPFGIASDHESDGTHLHCMLWATRDRWIDPEDGFDYGRAAEKVTLPPALYLAASRDRCLGHPVDVMRTARESGQDNWKYVLLGKKTGFRNDYDHVTMLTHREAPGEVYPLVLEWIENT